MQLVLPVTFRKQDSFDIFVEGENKHLLHHIQSHIIDPNLLTQSSQRISVITGPKAAGKTHMLLALCEFAAQHSCSQQYINLSSVKHLPPEALLGLVNKDLVCIDNLQEVDGDEVWQRAVFDVINQFTENQNRLLLLASNVDINKMTYHLLDLKTRLTWGTNFSLIPLKDEDKTLALSQHMQALGFVCDDKVAKFIISRYARDMHQLVSLLDDIDKASLQTKRRVTTHFIKSILDKRSLV